MSTTTTTTPPPPFCGLPQDSTIPYQTTISALSTQYLTLISPPNNPAARRAVTPVEPRKLSHPPPPPPGANLKPPPTKRFNGSPTRLHASSLRGHVRGTGADSSHAGGEATGGCGAAAASRCVSE
ncbi:hypothetical protein AC578_10037 [Pseudocercospora eumusae]|uniref:Uncharacterized protein n=1 Tax=Pseudocercospora eumusae TaxID=321146 RepID=A0A139H6K6_9PEZI|nr:hypothetical protein AC578_10037 [Pseudocercospora eumusae]